MTCGGRRLCDGRGLPLRFCLTPGQRHESTAFDELLIGADACLQDQNGAPAAWPVALGGDKGCRANWIDEHLLDLGIQPGIPSRENEDRDAPPVAFDRDLHRRRNVVERLIGWLKESRRVFSRFEKTAKNFAGMIRMACIRQCLKHQLT